MTEETLKLEWDKLVAEDENTEAIKELLSQYDFWDRLLIDCLADIFGVLDFDIDGPLGIVEDGQDIR